MLHRVPLRRKTKRSPAGRGSDDKPAGGVIAGALAAKVVCLCQRCQLMKPPIPSVSTIVAAIAASIIFCIRDLLCRKLFRMGVEELVRGVERAWGCRPPGRTMS